MPGSPLTVSSRAQPESATVADLPAPGHGDNESMSYANSVREFRTDHPPKRMRPGIAESRGAVFTVAMLHFVDAVDSRETGERHEGYRTSTP